MYILKVFFDMINLIIIYFFMFSHGQMDLSISKILFEAI